ncbi:Uma2 family endonuclease [Streptomyces griseofuscus]|uniref:Uma2 family endonuclease n=1 Tax=Streptomyces TaxID=1883 RepID=UPI00081F15DC|nr:MULTISPECIES: Uma2 family endonuclease [unclassified Streptomyces]MYQ95198.1 Uma2 family endonuclease [Streptomyces sp. SID4946]MYR88825.1 Uma2 family endonuclease [Streptomyces sp. SID685]SCF57926.1 Endonuclease, Uma2 family (restriction endonuclease fold) [Streptomyces sp. LamerLS-31b]SCF94130.1 Endonuclease, Uma2 family (restriction endonuclease fold) [Streptomyces sp. DconLS]
MTAVDERGLAKCFDNFEPPEGVKAELLRGVVVMMAGPDLVHNLIALHTQRQIPLERWYPIQTQDVSIAGEDSVPVPDLVVAAPDALPGSGRLLPSELITAVVEIVSKSSVLNDYLVKRSIYAAGKIPTYLIVDPIMAQCVLLTDPAGQGDDANYLSQHVTKFGDPVRLEALGVELDTSEFGTLPDVRPHRYP